MSEQVNHPSHYSKAGRKECIVEMEEKYGVEYTAVFCLMSAYKYLYRAGDKEGNPTERDINKAKWYFDYVNLFVTLDGNVLGNKCFSALYLDIEKMLKCQMNERYVIIQKQGNCERFRCDTLKQVANEYFGFSMANNPVYVIDTVENRQVEFEEFEKEYNEIIEYQKKKGWL